MEIKWLSPAKNSLSDIYNYYKKERSTKTARKIINNIRASVERLMKFPEMAPLEPLLSDCNKPYRSLVATPVYKVVYYIEDSVIYISDVWDCRQSPKGNRDKIERSHF